MENWDHVIIGGGIAGLSAARELRRMVPDQRVLIINSEPFLPYKRTTLSKELHSRVPVENIYLEPTSFWEESGIDIMPGVTVVSIDPENNTLELDDKGIIGWGKLLLATGSEPSYPANLSRHDLSDSLVFRTWADMDALFVRSQKAANILVSGMGILGIELADQLVRMGKTVTLMGSGPQLMHKHLSPRAAELLEESLLQRGVRLLYLDEVLSFSTQESHIAVTTVHEHAPFDLLVFCTGAMPETTLARSAGILCKRGILVDARLSTNKHHIYAAGDSAEHRDGRISQLWHESEHQGLVAGRIMAGSAETWVNHGFRMKCDIVDNYSFSLLSLGLDSSIPAVEQEQGDRYIGIYGPPEKTSGVVMSNDKENAPVYQQAVREGWSHEKVLAVFG